MEYLIKDTKFINGLNLMLITIDGNGDGLRNNIILKDNNDNEFFLKSVAMVCGNMKETTARNMLQDKPERAMMLAIKGMLPKNRLGRQIFKQLFVYAGNEHKHEAQKPERLEVK